MWKKKAPFCPKCKITPIFSTRLAALTWPQTAHSVQQETHGPWTWHACAQPGPPSWGSRPAERGLKAPGSTSRDQLLLLSDPTAQNRITVARAPHGPAERAPTLPQEVPLSITRKVNPESQVSNTTPRSRSLYLCPEQRREKRQTEDLGMCRCPLKAAFVSTHNP